MFSLVSVVLAPPALAASSHTTELVVRTRWREVSRVVYATEAFEDDPVKP